jgi:hypothetical protein
MKKRLRIGDNIYVNDNDGIVRGEDVEEVISL